MTRYLLDTNIVSEASRPTLNSSTPPTARSSVAVIGLSGPDDTDKKRSDYAIPAITLLVGRPRGLHCPARGGARPGSIRSVEVRASRQRTTDCCLTVLSGSTRPSPSKPDARRRGATRRLAPPVPPLYSGCSARVAWPAIWCAITSSSPDSHRVGITGLPGAAPPAASGRSRPSRQVGVDRSPKHRPSLRPSRHLRLDQFRGRRRHHISIRFLGAGDLNQRPQ